MKNHPIGIIGRVDADLTTLRPLTTDAQIAQIAGHFACIMETLGLDLTDASLKDTPRRFAKMYVNELCKGLKAENEPKVTLFPNDENYDQMLVEKRIHFTSMCEHHFVPIIGYVHIAYFPKDKIIGLSKFHRIVDFLAAKPQVQERFTQQIANYFTKALGTSDVAIIVDAKHYCCSMRGVKDLNSSTVTSYVGGRFREMPSVKEEFFKMIGL